MKWACASLGVLLLFLFTSPFTSAAADAAGGPDWKEIKSGHFILFYEGAQSVFADTVVRSAESFYDEIAHSLGYSRKDQFWLWEKRCRIYLYGSKEKFHQTSGQKAWSNGYALLATRTIISYQGSQEFLQGVLPHELAHLILKDFVGGESTLPLWMDEGLAMAQEKQRRVELDQIARKSIQDKKWIPLAKLSQTHSMVAASADEVALFYAESQSLVRFLLSAEKPGRFVQLCRDIRDGIVFEEALKKNYPKEFESVSELETKWVASNG